MAEPIRKTPALERDPLTRDPRSSGSRRTERTRAERDLGGRGEAAPKRHTGGREKPRKVSESDRPSSRPKTVRTTSRTGGGGRTPKRPRQVQAGTPARMLAPVAIIVFAIAAFAVVAGSGGDSTAPTSAEKSSETSGKSANTAKTTEPTRSTYRARSGDSFSSIAEKFGITAAQLQELNPDVDPLALQPGQKLKLKE